MKLLDPAQIRIRRRPHVVFYLWAWHLAFGWLIMAPLHAWAKAAWGTHPDGDADLFRPGAHSLLTWLGGNTAELATVVRTDGLLLLLFAVASPIVTGAVIASLTTGDEAGRPAGRAYALGVGLHAFLPLGAISVITGLLQALVCGVGLFLSAFIDDALKARIGDARALGLHLAVVALFVVGALMLGVVGDLARTAVVRDVTSDVIANERVVFTNRVRAGVLAAVRTSRRSFRRAFAGWGWRALVSVALLYAAALAGDRMSGVWALFALHQIVLVSRAALRVSWLASALRLTTP